MVDNNKEESGNKIGGGGGSSGGKGPRPSTTKEIARAAVEEEFRNKRKKRKRGSGGGRGGRGGGRGGDDYGASSSEEEGDDADGKGGDKRNRKAKKEGDGYDGEDDDRKEREAIEADLASRYRDRAAERRNEEGDDNDGDGSSKSKSSSGTTTTMNLIVPHNKKGLDLTLARQAKKQIQQDKDGHGQDDGRTHVEYGDDGDEDNTTSILERSGPHVLKDFVSKFTHGHIVSQRRGREEEGGGTGGGGEYTAIYRNRGMMDYLKLVVSYIEEDQEVDDNVEPPRKRPVAETMGRIYDAVESNTSTSRTLQQTQWVLALDGHPSDHRRKAWQVPRQEIQSSPLSSQDDTSSTAKNTTQQLQLSSETMDQIDRIFRARNRILHDMKKKRGGTMPSTSSPLPVSSDAKKNVANVDPTTSKQSTSVTQKTGTASQQQRQQQQDGTYDDDDDDDDIFGGVGDYVP